MAFAPLTIGSLVIPTPVALAPMAGYTDAVMRSLCRQHGCGFTYTEVANAAGLVHGSRPTFDLLAVAPGDHPVAAHMYGSDPAVLADAAAKVEALGRFDFIDINCGCPVRKIVAKGAGAALMRDPDRIGAIVAAVRRAVRLPVTIKTRSGPDPDRINVSEIAQAAEEGGAAAIAIHVRPASHHHRGAADWGLLARVKQERGIPVIGNGGIDKAEDAVAMFRETGVDAVMIGRAAIGNPWVFDNVYRLLQGDEPRGHSLEEHARVIEEHLAALIELKERSHRGRRRARLTPAQAAALHFRGHLHQYLCGFHSWSDVRRDMNAVRSPEAVRAAVARVIGRQRAIPPVAKASR